MRGRARSLRLLAMAMAFSLALSALVVAQRASAGTPDKQVAGPVTTAPSKYGLPPVRLQRVGGQVTGGFQTSPPRLTDTITPGSSRTYELVVVNQSGKHLVFSFEPRDLEPGRSGTYGDLADLGTSPRGAGSWLQMSQPTLKLDNLQLAHVPFRVAVPPGADAGGHYAAIVVSSLPPDQKGQVSMQTRIVTDVVTIVPGKVRYRVELGDMVTPALARGRIPVSFVVHNNGNIHSSPHAVVTFSGPFVNKRIEYDIPEMLPGGSRAVKVAWAGAPSIGRATVKVLLTREDGVTVTRTVGTSVLWSWRLVAVVAAVLLLVVTTLLVWWRRSRAWLDYLDQDDYNEAAPDTE